MADDNNYSSNLTLDEIVFENRNKEYGAYDLRNNYRKVLTRSFIVGTILFLVLALTPFIILKIQEMNKEAKQEVDANLIEIIQDDVILEQPKEEEPPPPPPPPKEEVQQEVIQNVVPEPKKAPKVETPPPPISKQLETTTGLVAQEGVKTPTYTPPPPPPSTGTKAATIEAPKVSTTEVYDTVDQGAEFPGGLKAFRQKVGSNFDVSIMEGEGGAIKADITFTVERDGSITNIVANGPNRDFNSEAVRTIKSIKNKWSPGKINGQAVRQKFRLPLTMNFE